MNIETAKDVILRTYIAAFKQGIRPSGRYLVSGPGIGKSDSIDQTAEDMARTLNEPVGIVVEMLASYSSVDIRGFLLPIKSADGVLDSIWSKPSWYPKAANMRVVEPDGTWHEIGTWKGELPRAGILFLDEFAQAEEEVQKPSAELILHGRVGTTILPKGWQVVAAGNRTSDRSGVMRELMFIVNRRCRLSIDPSLPAWLDWATKLPSEQAPHYMTISFAQKNPHIVFQDKVPDGTDPFCTPRTLCLMDRDLMALRTDTDIVHNHFPTDDIAREVCAGWIGDAATSQFFTHLKFAEIIPDLDDIVKDPMKAKVPSGLDAQMVTACMISYNVSKDNAKNLFRYLTRLKEEMQIFGVRTLSANPERYKHVVGLAEWQSWMTKNKDLLVASHM